jgi:hypothetical protein
VPGTGASLSGGGMAWVKQHVTDDGDKRFVACYRDAEGR